jgi:hypothetical protein
MVLVVPKAGLSWLRDTGDVPRCLLIWHERKSMCDEAGPLGNPARPTVLAPNSRAEVWRCSGHVGRLHFLVDENRRRLL